MRGGAGVASSGAIAGLIRSAAVPLEGGPRDHDALLETIGAARVVLLGEASHGTHEFYRERARITRRLIREKGFSAVAVEADWPDAYRVNRFVRGEGSDATASEALEGFRRFPTWMWRNADVLDLVGWLRPRRGARRFHDLRGDGHGRLRLGGAGRAQARAAGSPGQLRNPPSRGRGFPFLPAAPGRRSPRRSAARAEAGTRDRGDLPSGDGTGQPLLLRPPFGPVRRRPPFRPQSGRGAPERTAGWERGEVPETFPSGV